jgi:hypothetical protein
MVAILSLLVILSISILITRIATVVLVNTGLSREMARFQARSAFTGVGFTTTETETVVRHPLRRRVVFTLMLLGNAGFVTAISSLVLGFISPVDGSSLWLRVLSLTGGLAVLFIVAKSGWVDVHLSRLIIWFLRRYASVDLKDYASVLHLAAGYEVSEVTVREKDWLTGKRLYESGLREEGVNVLGIQRKRGGYIGTPTPETRIHARDTLILYGRRSSLKELERRRKGATGDSEHDQAVEKQRREVERYRRLQE